MAETLVRRSLTKLILLVLGGLLVLTLLFVIACHIAVQRMFRGIESSRATGLSATWDPNTMWNGNSFSESARIGGGTWVSRTADLHMCTDAFDAGRTKITQIALSHHGFLVHLATESHSGRGRTLSATVSVPAAELDGTVLELKKLGRLDSVAEAGEDSAVKLDNMTRNVDAAKSTLTRLQSLQHERKGQLHDELEVEKEIAQADSVVREATRQRDTLLSTVVQAQVRLELLEDFRAPLKTSFAGAWFEGLAALACASCWRSMTASSREVRARGYCAGSGMKRSQRWNYVIAQEYPYRRSAPLF
jgi:hypothetical protein